MIFGVFELEHTWGKDDHDEDVKELKLTQEFYINEKCRTSLYFPRRSEQRPRPGVGCPLSVLTED